MVLIIPFFRTVGFISFRRLPNRGAYPNPFNKSLRAFSGLSASFHFADFPIGGRTQTLSTIPLCGIVVFFKQDYRLTAFVVFLILQRGAYPNPFNKSLRVLLCFLLLFCLQKQAFDTASKQKTLSLS
jgi:hypothetical protein